MALYQPLTLLDMVVYHRENANIERIKEVRCYHPYRTIPADIRKSACAIFANEVINKTIREEGYVPELFEFLEQTFIQLDDLATGVEYFPLIFLVRLSYLLGFGATTQDVVLGTRMLSGEDEVKLRELLEASYGESLSLTTLQRRELLDVMLRFYADHMEWLGDWKSITVLREVMM